ncbi:MAG: DUF5924 family protein [Acidobacteriota bacterium]
MSGKTASTLGSLLEILEDWRARYARVFWILHSIWALGMGLAVVLWAGERYHFLPWVGVFLVLVWLSTFVFTRWFRPGLEPETLWKQGFISYVTRVLYQETLFFLLPFYFYSTTWPSWNMGFFLLLAAMAFFACLDLAFDRCLKRFRLFAAGYFSLVTFAALNFLFPLLLRWQVHRSIRAALALSLAAGLALVVSASTFSQPWRLAGAVLLLASAGWIADRLLPVVPPVPLRVLDLSFAGSFDPATFQSPVFFRDKIPRAELRDGKLYVVARVFAPVRLPVRAVFRFSADGVPVATSRVIDVPAHRYGFRIWYAVALARLDAAGREGSAERTVRVEVWTDHGQLLGRSEVTLG